MEAIYGYINAADSQSAYRWYSGLEEAVLSLAHLPHRGVRTHEDLNLRHLLYGNKPHIYRIIYSIDDQAQRVTVAQIRHGSRRPLSPPNT
jgi:toxin ParE1/3/4